MIIQTVYTYPDGNRVLWDTENECYLVRSKTPDLLTTHKA